MRFPGSHKAGSQVAAGGIQVVDRKVNKASRVRRQGNGISCTSLIGQRPDVRNKSHRPHDVTGADGNPRRKCCRGQLDRVGCRFIRQRGKNRRGVAISPLPEEAAPKRERRGCDPRWTLQSPCGDQAGRGDRLSLIEPGTVDGQMRPKYRGIECCALVACTIRIARGMPDCVLRFGHPASSPQCRCQFKRACSCVSPVTATREPANRLAQLARSGCVPAALDEGPCGLNALQ